MTLANIPSGTPQPPPPRRHPSPCAQAHRDLGGGEGYLLQRGHGIIQARVLQ
jgi:hypothetical protein